RRLHAEHRMWQLLADDDRPVRVRQRADSVAFEYCRRHRAARAPRRPRAALVLVVALDLELLRAPERRLDRRCVSRAGSRARQRLRVIFPIDGAHELAPLVVLVARREPERIDGAGQKAADSVFEANRAARGVGHFRKPAFAGDDELCRVPVGPDDRRRPAEPVALDARDAAFRIDEPDQTAVVVVDETEPRLVRYRIERPQMTAVEVELINLAAVLARDQVTGRIESGERSEEYTSELQSREN